MSDHTEPQSQGDGVFRSVGTPRHRDQAAEELAVSPSAVSQQIATVETQLGVRLFRREKQRLVLTLDGDRMFRTVTQAFGAIRNARSAIAHGRDLRSLTIRVSPSFGVRWLGPRIGSFAAENPDWNIRVDATPDFSAFDTESVDFDLRYGTGAWSGLTVFPVMHDLVLPLCSPDYLAQLQDVSDNPVEQLAHARLIDSVKMLYRWDLWIAGNRITLPDLSYPFRFDRSSMSIELAKQSVGITLDSVTLCLEELERGDLVPFSTRFEVVDFEAYWIVCPPRHLNRRVVKRFSDWLADATAAHDAAARNFLAARGCSFRGGSAAELIEVKPWGL